jgi:hypothetical protein
VCAVYVGTRLANGRPLKPRAPYPTSGGLKRFCKGKWVTQPRRCKPVVSYGSKDAAINMGKHAIRAGAALLRQHFNKETSL